jgi:antitoxin (DNA-binding transcriptional repressor) of toxin-antitoxin stability system
MQAVPLSEAAANLPSLIEAAVRGEEGLISENGHLVKLVPVSPDQPSRRTSSGKGTFFMATDFDEPLEDFREYME